MMKVEDLAFQTTPMTGRQGTGGVTPRPHMIIPLKGRFPTGVSFR